MKPIKLIIRTKTEKYPVLIGKNLVENLSSLFNQNSIFRLSFPWLAKTNET